MLLLRLFADDGFEDVGLKFKLKESWCWYLLSLLAPPVTIFLIIILGIMFEVTSINGELGVLLPLFLTGMATQFIPRFILSMCEE